MFFSLFMKFVGPPKGGGGPDPKDPPPLPGSAPALTWLGYQIRGKEVGREERTPSLIFFILNVSYLQGMEKAEKVHTYTQWNYYAFTTRFGT